MADFISMTNKVRTHKVYRLPELYEYQAAMPTIA
jgi:hypothetical protein